MKPQTSMGLILGGTFLVGGILGALATGSMAHLREQRIQSMRQAGGFVEQMERLLDPRDEAQREALRPYLEAADFGNREVMDGAMTSLRDIIGAMRDSVAPLLDSAQLERLDDFIRRPPTPPMGRPGPGRPPPGGMRPGGPPPGGRPPGGPPPGGVRPGGPPPG